MASYYLEKAALEKLNILNSENSSPYNLIHILSKAYGFINCLLFTRNPDTNEPFFSEAEINRMIVSIDDIWEVNHDDIINLKRFIDNRFKF